MNGTMATAAKIKEPIQGATASPNAHALYEGKISSMSTSSVNGAKPTNNPDTKILMRWRASPVVTAARQISTASVGNDNPRIVSQYSPLRPGPAANDVSQGHAVPAGSHTSARLATAHHRPTSAAALATERAIAFTPGDLNSSG